VITKRAHPLVLTLFIAFIGLFTPVQAAPSTSPASLTSPTSPAPSAQPEPETSEDRVLKIGVREANPFILLNYENTPGGYSVAFWENLNRYRPRSYEYVIYNSLEELLDALESGEVDMSINPVTVTQERLYHLDFSQPYIISGSTVARERVSEWNLLLGNLFSWPFLRGILVLVGVIFLFGLLIWVAERRRNESQFAKGLSGLGDGFWWSAVTMTTVGYGDKSPVTRTGRFIGLIWMFLAIIMISGLTASIATSLTVHRIEDHITSVHSLEHFTVAALASSSDAELLRTYNIPFLEVHTVEEGLYAVVEKQVDLFLHDRPILQYHINQNDAFSGLRLIDKNIKMDYYSFAFPKGSPLVSELDPYILATLKSPEWNAVMQKMQN
jgi:polar amino acid transport system substrate-binding protein